MKTVTVPSEVMSVKDTIAGNISLEQLGMLVLGGIGMVYIYVTQEPKSALSVEKLIFGLMIMGGAGVLAIRLGGRLIIEWALLGMAFKLRPKLYVSDKAGSYGRPRVVAMKREKSAGVQAERVKVVPKAADVLPVMLVNRNQDRRKVRLMLTKKGGLYVG